MDTVTIIISIACMGIGYLIGSRIRSEPLYTVNMSDILETVYSKDLVPDIERSEYPELILEYAKFIRGNTYLLDEGIDSTLRNIWYLFLYENKIPVKNK
jgi:hypothetical protein